MTNERQLAKQHPTMAEQADIHELYETLHRKAEHERVPAEHVQIADGCTGYLLREDSRNRQRVVPVDPQGKEFGKDGVDIDPNADGAQPPRESTGCRGPGARQPDRIRRHERDGVLFMDMFGSSAICSVAPRRRKRPRRKPSTRSTVYLHLAPGGIPS